MKRTLRSLFITLFTLIGSTVMAQNSAGISGVVKDANGETLINAQVEMISGGIDGQRAGRTVTDFDGQYIIKPLEPGLYSLVVVYLNQKTIVDNVRINFNALHVENVQFAPVNKGTSKSEINELGEVIFISQRDAKPPLINPGQNVKTAEQIEALPVFGTSEIVSTNAGVYSAGNGRGLSVMGGRGNGNTYIVDGIVLAPGSSGFTNQPPGSVDQISTLTGGISPKYGDVSGGVIAITTKGSSDKLSGNIFAEHSVDGYNNNQASFNISGPLTKRYVLDSAGNRQMGKDSTYQRRTGLGFVVNGQFNYDLDASPQYNPVYVAKDETLNELREHPLTAIASTSGSPFLAYSSEFVTRDQLETQKRQPNNERIGGRINGKLDYHIDDNIAIYANGFFGYSRYNNQSRASYLFSPETQPITNQISGRGSLRFTQKFGRPEDAGKIGISNAFYQVQVDYLRDYVETHDEKHGENTFDYGYVGKFEEVYQPVYGLSVDDTTQRTAIRLLGYQTVGVNFTPSDKNPGLAKYTSEYFRLTSQQPRSLLGIQNGRGLRNGDNAGTSFSLWRNPGSANTGWNRSREDQFAITVDASFDYVNKQGGPRHAVEFGLYYQQRNERSYAIAAAATWGLMRQLTQRAVGNALDFTNPIVLVGGNIYDAGDVINGNILTGPNDTFKYNRLFDAAASLPGTFDYNLRRKLNLSNNDFINVDGLDPSTFDVSMFAADELLNAGQNIVRYQGYDYKGNLETGQVNFNDFWTKTDANGRYTRPIAAFRPNYIAGYVSDFITYKDFKMNIGFRVDRYDANTKVLRDPYSLNPVQSASSANAAYAIQNGGVHPSNINGDYVAYVTDATSSTPEIIGYRNGDDWFDYTGKYIPDPTKLKDYSGGRDPQPLLQNVGKPIRITDPAYGTEVDKAFVDYKAAVNVSPRINFTFPISVDPITNSDKAVFFAHYDVLVQRPIDASYATPVDYLAIQQSGQVTIGNPNLKPQKLIDWEMGFAQQLSFRSGITITAFLKERKDLIQYRPYLYAYPNTYFSYGNRDFTSYKGFTAQYELRRVGPLAATLNYTFGVAEGTGSSANSASVLLTNFISAGLPNLRYVTPLSVDSRHIFALNLDYHYVSIDNKTNKGPMLFGKYIFENAGFNMIGRVRSGEPYTRYAFSQTILGGVNQTRTINGAVNDSRLPWHYMMDIRFDKSFAIRARKGSTDAKSLYNLRRNGGLRANVYVRIENLLNTRDVLGVYGYSGRTDDDGYLTSPAGLQTVNTYNNTNQSRAFVDQYAIAADNSGFLNIPRRINIGFQLFF